jgi:hypothetical protein
MSDEEGAAQPPASVHVRAFHTSAKSTAPATAIVHRANCQPVTDSGKNRRTTWHELSRAVPVESTPKSPVPDAFVGLLQVEAA